MSQGLEFTYRKNGCLGPGKISPYRKSLRRLVDVKLQQSRQNSEVVTCGLQIKIIVTNGLQLKSLVTRGLQINSSHLWFAKTRQNPEMVTYSSRIKRMVTCDLQIKTMVAFRLQRKGMATCGLQIKRMVTCALQIHVKKEWPSGKAPRLVVACGRTVELWIYNKNLSATTGHSASKASVQCIRCYKP